MVSISNIFCLVSVKLLHKINLRGILYFPTSDIMKLLPKNAKL